jgi:integrase
MVHKLVHNHLVHRGDTYYFRFRIPAHTKALGLNLPREIKRSLRTDSYSIALALVCEKLPLIKLIRECHNPANIELLIGQISDFSFESRSDIHDYQNDVAQELTPTLSQAWYEFTQWKSWTSKQSKANQRIFDNLIFFIGDIPVDEVTKLDIRTALSNISGLPQRNKNNYKHQSLEQLVRMDIPEHDVVSGKYVKEHLKLCQSLFSRYLKSEIDLLTVSPTEGIRYEYQDNRYASLNDEQVRVVLAKSQLKPDWFRWFILLALYSGARRSELIELNKSDFKYCTDTNRHYFHIRKGKTKAAVRLVPLHHNLVENGLLKWVESSEKERLFNVAANSVTGLFNSLLDERINYNGERIVLHSLRHTFITKVRAAGISNVLVQQVVGHEKSGAGQTDRYTHTFHLKDLLPVIDNAMYE